MQQNFHRGDVILFKINHPLLTHHHKNHRRRGRKDGSKTGRVFYCAFPRFHLGWSTISVLIASITSLVSLSFSLCYSSLFFNTSDSSTFVNSISILSLLALAHLSITTWPFLPIVFAFSRDTDLTSHCLSIYPTLKSHQ